MTFFNFMLCADMPLRSYSFIMLYSSVLISVWNAFYL